MAVIELKSAIPGTNGAPSTTAQDIAQAVTQALGQMAAGLHVTVMQNSSSLILTGDPNSIRLAKELIAKLDVVPPLVELDTEVLEIDGSLAKNLGLELPTAVISTTFEEVQPTPDPYGNPGRIGKIQPITRTPIQLTAELNLLIQHGDGRVLADPRIVTLSGHDANFQAGDTLSILTTTGGGVGTVVTTQLQSFNTGVTLDITPIVTADGNITVTVHPTVNSLSGDPNGVPEISTRNAQTVVTLHDNQTLVIGGLIQEEDTRTITSLPVLGNIPIIGGLFKNNDTNNTSNELVIVVTPHIIRDGEPTPPPGATMGLPTPQPLPTVPPGMALPTVRPSGMPSPGAPAVLNTPMPSSSPAPSTGAAADTVRLCRIQRVRVRARATKQLCAAARCTADFLRSTCANGPQFCDNGKRRRHHDHERYTRTDRHTERERVAQSGWPRQMAGHVPGRPIGAGTCATGAAANTQCLSK